MNFDPAALDTLIRQVIREVLVENSPSNESAQLTSTTPASSTIPGTVTVCADDRCRPRVERPPHIRDPHALKQLIADTPARVAQGRAGTRYLTRVYVGLRAEHAIAIDAVAAEIEESFAIRLGCLPLRTRAVDKKQYLLFPDQGRRLDEESRLRLEREASRNVDVQLIAGDGLSPWAILHQGETLVPALIRELHAKGFSVGKPLFVKYARIGVQDEIGVLTHAKSTIILVGERPGLGTGDSLSIYTAYNPRLGQDNAEKNCISNIRPLGLPPEQAAKECAELLRRTFAAGGGGIKLVRPTYDVVSRHATEVRA